jgi:2,3-bisphosphoglycerate-independent phosphoglycerate mutase
MAFIMPDFENLKQVEFGYVPHEATHGKGKTEGPTFKRIKYPKNIFFVTMTEYQKNLPVSAIAFPPQNVPESLPEVLSKYKLNQAHIAESEKERMVNFYFDGMREARYPGEDLAIIASPNVPTYDKKPEMSVFKLVKKFKQLLGKDKYHFFVLNFANPDMVGHSGNLAATIAAVEYVDKATGELVNTTLAKDGTCIITADHGNAEELMTFPTRSFFVTSSGGSVNTEHSNNPVPIYIIGRQFEKKASVKLSGVLTDVAPTILHLMGLPKPGVMTGRNLLGSTLENTGNKQEHAGINPA